MRFITNTLVWISLLLLICCAASNKAEASEPSEVVVILGDSNIWLAGDSCNKHQGWMAWFRDMRQPESCLSYARSGATWSNTPRTVANTTEDIAILGDNNVIYNQVLRLTQAVEKGTQPTPTLILVSAGGNDAWFSHKRPDEFNLTVDEAFASDSESLLATKPSQVLSLPGAIRYNCLMLRDAFPQAQIVLLTATQMSKVEPEMLSRVSDIIEQSGDKMGIPTIRLDIIGPINRDSEIKERVNTYDGIHTSELGAQRVAQCVLEQLNNIIPVK